MSRTILSGEVWYASETFSHFLTKTFDFKYPISHLS